MEITLQTIEERQEDILRFENSIKHVQGQVYFILKNHPESRGNDGILLCLWLQTFNGIGSIGGLLKLASDNKFNFETVRRSRQKIQAAGLFLPDDETLIKRRRLESVWRVVTGA